MERRGLKISDVCFLYVSRKTSWKQNTLRKNVRMNLNGNKLVKVRSDIMNKKRLTDFELSEIKGKLIADVKDMDSGNVVIRDDDVDDKEEGTGGVICTDADTRVARTGYVDLRENISHIGSLDDIPINEVSEDEFDLVAGGNHNMSYDTTSNIITLSCFNQVSMKIVKLTLTLKNETLTELEKKTTMLGILRLETKLLKLMKN